MPAKSSSLWKIGSKKFQSLELFLRKVPGTGKLAATLLLTVAPFARAADDITLEQAINTALQDNRQLLGLVLSLQSSYLGIDSARNAFKLTLTPEGTGGLRSDGEESAVGLRAERDVGLTGTRLTASGTLTENLTEDVPDYYRGLARVQVEQPILRRLGPLVNLEPVRQAQSRVKQARRELEIRRADIVVRVVESFEDLFRLQNQVVFDEQSLARADKLYRLTHARELQGRATRVDTLRTEFQRGRAEVQLTATRERLASLRRDFADLLGQPPARDYQAVASPRLELQPPSTEAALAIALSNRLDYAQARQDLDDAARGVSVARRNLLPDLNVLGRYEWSSDGEQRDRAMELDQEDWFVGLTLDTDLHRRAERLALTQAHLSEKSAEVELADLESALRRQVQQALLAHERALKEMAVAEQNYNLARDRARLARRLFAMGRGDNFTVTDAESELLDAESEMLSTQAEANVAAYRVLQMLGTLIEAPDDLKPAARNS